MLLAVWPSRQRDVEWTALVLLPVWPDDKRISLGVGELPEKTEMMLDRFPEPRITGF